MQRGKHMCMCVRRALRIIDNFLFFFFTHFCSALSRGTYSFFLITLNVAFASVFYLCFCENACLCQIRSSRSDYALPFWCVYGVFFFFYLRCFAIFTSTDWEAYADFTVKRRGNRFFFLASSFFSLINMLLKASFLTFTRRVKECVRFAAITCACVLCYLSPSKERT